MPRGRGCEVLPQPILAQLTFSHMDYLVDTLF